MQINEIIKVLRKKRVRITPLRKALLSLFLEKGEPLSVSELTQRLEEKGFKPNQSTLYRQLDTLMKCELLDLVRLDPKRQYFELKLDHHHHFVCETCNDIQDVHSEVVESAFYQFEAELRKNGLSVQKHELTFFGACQSCH